MKKAGDRDKQRQRLLSGLILSVLLHCFAFLVIMVLILIDSLFGVRGRDEDRPSSIRVYEVLAQDNAPATVEARPAESSETPDHDRRALKRHDRGKAKNKSGLRAAGESEDGTDDSNPYERLEQPAFEVQERRPFENKQAKGRKDKPMSMEQAYAHLQEIKGDSAFAGKYLAQTSEPPFPGVGGFGGIPMEPGEEKSLCTGILCMPCRPVWSGGHYTMPDNCGTCPY
ncbi:MAG: hypothetical protein ABIJ56_04780 [Pseudomonadota bacterium]